MRYTLIWAAALALASCDLTGVGSGTFGEGRVLEGTEYSEVLPTSRRAYAELGTFVTGGVVTFRPGTGPDDPPEVVRGFSFPGHLVWDAQIDRDGFLWVATPDRVNGGALRVVYVVDPFASEVVRVIRLPEELRAVAGLVVGPERVYLRAWRNGFSGAIGAVDRRCAADESLCGVSLFTELGNVGVSSSAGALRLSGSDLVSFSLRNSGDKRESTDRIDTRTSEILASSPYSGTSTADAGSYYVIGGDGTGGPSTITRLDERTLSELGSVQAEPGFGSLIAAGGGRLYVGGFRERAVKVYYGVSLEHLETIDTSAATELSYALGFVAPNVLVLNGAWWLDTRTGAVSRIPQAPEFGTSQALRLPEGHPFAN